MKKEIEVFGEKGREQKAQVNFLPQVPVGIAS